MSNQSPNPFEPGSRFFRAPGEVWQVVRAVPLERTTLVDLVNVETARKRSQHAVGGKLYVDGTELEPMTGTCSVCGCSEESACPGGCWWAGANLCTSCVPQQELAS